MLIILVMSVLLVSCSEYSASPTVNTKTESEPIKSLLVDAECAERVMSILGDKFRIEYRISERDETRFRNFERLFPDFTEEFDKYASMRSIDHDMRLGWKVGENKKWLYGSGEYEWTYDEEISDEEGFILGRNYFKIMVKIDDVEDNFPERYQEMPWEYNRNYPVVQRLQIPSAEIVKVTECEFAD
jgi:hypothetical protein